MYICKNPKVSYIKSKLVPPPLKPTMVCAVNHDNSDTPL